MSVHTIAESPPIAEVVWRVVQDPESKRPADRVVVCESLTCKDGIREIVDRMHYELVSVRAPDLLKKKFTLSQAIKLAFDNGFSLVPKSLCCMVTAEIGTGIPVARVNVIPFGEDRQITSVVQKSGRSLSATGGAVLIDCFEPGTIFTFFKERRAK